MKTYSIGRDLNCDIVINDSTDVISRRHALLNVTSSGKMTIIDQSRNGTYINGIRISQNVPVPVTRKDIISLAHVAKLDWNQVPKSNQWIKIAIVAAIVVIIGTMFGIKRFIPNAPDPIIPTPIESYDSTLIRQKREAARLDSLKNIARQDSIKQVAEKARQDSINAAKRGTGPAKTGTKKSKESKDKDNKSRQKNKRTIG